MTLDETRAQESIEIAITNAITRMHILQGKNRRAIISEYKEWLFQNSSLEDVVVLKSDLE